MIALICFDKDLVLLRSEAEKLKLNYTEGRFGMRAGEMEKMYDNELYRDEYRHDTDTGEYFDKDNRKVGNWGIKDRPPEILDWVHVKQNNHLVDLDSFAPLCRHKYWIEKAVRDQAAGQGMSAVIDRLEAKANELRQLLDSGTFNTRCNVHLGGGLITTYNDLKLCEECCTDALQIELNNGWRIIAVCVKDARRPDYVLGRYNPALQVYGKHGADRL